jgi:phosphoglycolate phosphatase-like HAD superfamily hydrolase
MPQVRPLSDVRVLFQRMIGHGWKIALATSAKEKELKVYKDIVQISDLVESEASSEDADKSKPHPDIFLAAAQHLGISPRECIAVGDTPYDAEAALKAGMSAIGVLSGGFPEAQLREAGFRSETQAYSVTCLSPSHSASILPRRSLYSKEPSPPSARRFFATL